VLSFNKLAELQHIGVIFTGYSDPALAMAPLPTLVAGTNFFSDPSLTANPAATGCLHSQVSLTSPPELLEALHTKYNSDMEFFASQYYNATNIVLASLARVLADKQG
jgi:hypothetical protein